MTINFYLNNKKLKRGGAILYCYIRGIGQNLISINTNIKIDQEQWNPNKQEIRRSHPDSSQLNTYLDKMKSEVNAFYLEYIKQNEIKPEEFKSLLIKHLFSVGKKSIKLSVVNAFKSYLDFTKIDKSPGTLRIYQGLFNQLKQYEEHCKLKLYFEDINLEFFEKFLEFSIKVQKNTNNTAYKKNKQLKTFFKWAEDRGMHKNEAYKKVKIREELVDNVHLSDKELKNLYNLDLSDNLRLDRVRDFFCLECYTGQRYSDIAAFDFNDIKNGFWHLRTKKTKDILKIPLNQYAMAILNKYKELGTLPALSNQRINDYLKELAKLAGIDEPIKKVYYRGSKRIEEIKPKYELISSHVGRRTFVTLSLEKGMRPEVVMTITGHKDLKTFSKYIKITSSITQQEMLKAWE